MEKIVNCWLFLFTTNWFSFNFTIFWVFIFTTLPLAFLFFLLLLYSGFLKDIHSSHMYCLFEFVPMNLMHSLVSLCTVNPAITKATLYHKLYHIVFCFQDSYLAETVLNLHYISDSFCLFLCHMFHHNICNILFQHNIAFCATQNFCFGHLFRMLYVMVIYFYCHMTTKKKILCDTKK